MLSTCVGYNNNDSDILGTCFDVLNIFQKKVSADYFYMYVYEIIELG